ncbi:MAG TPA: DUF2752 domain-containing protein [Pyrinomonadaceae bacterium]|nr:DUF2752 domain-containing protein [Pyrinomonadaceae bacterium]
MNEAAVAPRASEAGPKTSERILAAGGATAMLAGAGVVAYFDPTKAGFFPVCPLYSLTGYACPGCGMTRGFHALFHGDILTALDYNALLPIFGALLGVGFLSLFYFAIKGRGLPFNLYFPRLLWVALVMLLTFGVVRNLPWYPFTVLFP